MGVEGLWLTPLILLPGVGLLVMSTSARYAQIHTEFHHVLMADHEISEMIITHLTRRAVMFRNAMVGLYVSIGVFALASLLGLVTSGWSEILDRCRTRKCRHRGHTIRIHRTNS